MMKTFLVIRRQANEGCDYTIGCGISVEKIEAESFEEAKSKIVDFDEMALEVEIKSCMDDYGDKWEYYLSDYINDEIPLNKDNEWKLDSCELVEVSRAEDLVGDFEVNSAKLEAVLKKYRKQYKEIKERAELERLKAKYDK